MTKSLLKVKPPLSNCKVAPLLTVTVPLPAAVFVPMPKVPAATVVAVVYVLAPESARKPVPCLVKLPKFFNSPDNSLLLPALLMIKL